jgi:8-oxo-dGTP pyrophosphatase MutT (NUDIX family)
MNSPRRVTDRAYLHSRSMPPCGLDVAATTAGQPFCAGVILMVDGRLVATLNRDHLPAELEDKALRVGGVGGGQEPGETIWECAVREALEEVSCDVKLLSSPRTYLRDVDGSLRPARCRDALAPLLFEWGPREDSAPYAPGLPSGERLYNAFFLARTSGAPHPGDVEGLVLMPPSVWPLIERQATIRDVVEAGASVLERTRILDETRLWTFPDDSMRTVCELVTRDPELVAALR